VEVVLAVNRADDPPDEIIVVELPARIGPAAARNLGSRRAMGDVLVFVDADVEVHPDVFRRIRDAFAVDPELTAIFGSYDDDPGANGVVSTFRNLLHHHVHHEGAGAATTFWPASARCEGTHSRRSAASTRCVSRGHPSRTSSSACDCTRAVGESCSTRPFRGNT
jgi:glycosyltransferase involved in cell wall biosynthesis